MNKKLNCILLIDDDEPTNVLNSTLIEEAACTEHIEAMDSAQDALQYLAVRSEKEGNGLQCPDLIFLDINMPAMNGWEFLEKYNDLPEACRQKMVIVMLTTSLNPDDRTRAGKIPLIAEFETKPITEDKLDKILHKHFPYMFARD